MRRPAFLQISGIGRRPVAWAYVATVVVFVWCVARFYNPQHGFAQMIEFGGRLEKTWIAPLGGTAFYEVPDSDGYDAQFYAQIAMDPALRDPGLKGALDAPAYRARRILFGWTAYVLGLGRPAWILQAYALQNALTWLILAALLLHWFPPNGWNNFIRWAGVLFAAGMCASVRDALVDGPSLLLIALGVWCVEKKRPWLATVVFAAATLGRETNALAAGSLVDPNRRTWRDFATLMVRAVLVAAPLVLWMGYVHYRLGASVDAGSRNFDVPGLSLAAKWGWTFAALPLFGGNNSMAVLSLVALIALAVQCLFLALRPTPDQPWWRVGSVFGALMLVLGAATWEGDPGAALRVLLPLQLAFNVLVPTGRRWMAILLLGNLSVLAAPAILAPPINFPFQVTSSAPAKPALFGPRWSVEFTRGWHIVENKGSRYWCWSRGSAELTIFNPGPAPVRVKLDGQLTAAGSRHVAIEMAGVERWAGDFEGDTQHVAIPDLLLQPGRNRLVFHTDRPGRLVGGGDQRMLAFSISDLAIAVKP